MAHKGKVASQWKMKDHEMRMVRWAISWARRHTQGSFEPVASTVAKLCIARTPLGPELSSPSLKESNAIAEAVLCSTSENLGPHTSIVDTALTLAPMAKSNMPIVHLVATGAAEHAQRVFLDTHRPGAWVPDSFGLLIVIPRRTSMAVHFKSV